MPAIPTDALGAAAFLLRRQYRTIELAPGRIFHAVSETEHPHFGDDWLWADDNAKVLEFVSRPEIWAQFPTELAEILRFIDAMCRGPFIFRRVATPRLELASREGPDTNYIHALMHVRSEAENRSVRVGIRFHDGRTADNLLLAGNAVEFTHRGRRTRINVAGAISEFAAEQQGPVLTVRQAGELFFSSNWRRRRLGRISYLYTIDAGSMLIGVEAVLEVDPAAAVSDVVLAIGHDYLSHGQNGVRYDTVRARPPAGSPLTFAAGDPGRTILPIRGAGYYSIAQPAIAGFALAIHSAPRGAVPLEGLDVRVRERGWLHLVQARYRFDGPCRGARLAVAEDKMLTAGGFYGRVDDYAELLQTAATERSSTTAVIDTSVSYDYGAEINAFAKSFAVAATTDVGPDRQTSAELSRHLFDIYLNYYDECFVSGHYQKQNTILSRQLAFVILGVVTMYRATGAAPYLEKLRELSEVLLDFEVPYEGIAGESASGFPYGISSERAAFVDGHSASLLALTQAARYLDDQRFVTAIDRGLAAYCWETCGIGQEKRSKIDVVSTGIMLEGVPGHAGPLYHTENSYWNFNVGLALRFFNALRASPRAELQAIAAKYRDRMALFEIVLRRQIERSITEHADGIEIRTSVDAGETNSETQPWVMLGLLGHPCD